MQYFSQYFKKTFSKTCRISLGIEHLKGRFCPLQCMLQTSHINIQSGNESLTENLGVLVIRS